MTKSFCKKNKGHAQWSSFSTSILPHKRQVLEQLLHDNNILQLSAARIVANELEKRWLCCKHAGSLVKEKEKQKFFVKEKRFYC